MTSPPTVDPAIPFVADIILKHLVAPTRAKDVGLKFYRKELKKQRATEKDLKEVSLIAAKHFVEKRDEWVKNANSEITQEVLNRLLKESIENAIEQYSSEK